MITATLVQKDSVLDELERLTEGLVAQARASHDPALDLRCAQADSCTLAMPSVPHRFEVSLRRCRCADGPF